MFKKIIAVAFIAFISLQASAQQQFAEGTIRYRIQVSSGSDAPGMLDMMDGAYQLLSIKGAQTRNENKSLLGSSTLIHDARTGNAVLLNEYGGQKIMIRMNAEHFKDRNRKYADLKFTVQKEQKKIAGYNCKLAIATLKDGASFRVWFTPDLVIPNKSYAAEFVNLPGVPLEYASQLGKINVTFVAEKLTIQSVPAATFDIPKSGYREMSYEELNKMQRN
ncbi:MAG: hypothetical protein ACO3BD_07205 [Chitinophagaceae bacterium]